jgi:hypothetical protein
MNFLMTCMHSLQNHSGIILCLFKWNTIYPVTRKLLARVTEKALDYVITPYKNTANIITPRKGQVKSFSSSCLRDVGLSYCHKLVGRSTAVLREGRIYSQANYYNSRLIYHCYSLPYKVNIQGSIYREQYEGGM